MYKLWVTFPCFISHKLWRGSEESTTEEVGYSGNDVDMGGCVYALRLSE